MRLGALAITELGRRPRRIAAELSGPLRAAVRGAVTAALDQLDLTQLVIDCVDLDRVAAQLDVEAVIRRVDIVGICRQVVIDIDLPEIIRESTVSMASESVRDVRMRSISADQFVSTWVRRILRPGHADAPPATGSATAAPDDQ
ncbi:hypothetical protein D5S19_00555 [Amycolatopsis panacis]|uniref:Uncharacterized protein n=1 Tax=Amycolatopsis panacis TaxID=2340917 RepID=A0A419IBN2_9PSEU|nr:hypothetical protein D5S19_00555 [Amycolatopsis panacis]